LAKTRQETKTLEATATQSNARRPATIADFREVLQSGRPLSLRE
jgi:hypothetical protein